MACAVDSVFRFNTLPPCGNDSAELPFEAGNDAVVAWSNCTGKMRFTQLLEHAEKRRADSTSSERAEQRVNVTQES